MNILSKANEIINERSEERHRKYGDFDESMNIMSAIATAATGKDITPEDCYIIMVALKLSRHAHAYNEDNLLDAVGYLGALNNYINNKTNKNEQ